jgi:hypothetical protein
MVYGWIWQKDGLLNLEDGFLLGLAEGSLLD